MENGGALLLLGTLLVAGLLGGWVARRLKLPTLTGQIGAGILLGGYGFDLVSGETAARLDAPINDLAMALVLFVLGGQFQPSRIRGGVRRLLTLSLTESAVTLLVVAGLTALVVPRVEGALLLGVMAVAVAPATTLVVLGEYGAKGPVSDLVRLLTALSNVWSVLLFEFVLLFLVLLEGGDAGPLDLAVDVFGSLLVGAIAAHVLIFLRERAPWSGDVVPLLAVLLLTIGLCKIVSVPHMLAFLIVGAVVANRSRLFDPMVQSLDAFAQPAFVAFFVLSGLHLDFGLLARHWEAVGIYVLGRTLGKVFGTRAGLRFSGLRLPASTDGSTPPVGLGLLCQAGAAIALAHHAAKYDADLSHFLLSLILGGVVVFELIGPLLLKQVAVAAGEVSLSRLLTHGDREAERMHPLRALRQTLSGRKAPSGVQLATMTVDRIMRRGVSPLREDAGLDEVLRYANHSPFNQFPVVDSAGRLKGVIQLRDLEYVAYDRAAARLVTAADLVTLTPEEASVPASAKLPEAVEAFRDFPGNTLAVVASREDPRFVGVLERAEVVPLARRLAESAASAAGSAAPPRQEARS